MHSHAIKLINPLGLVHSIDYKSQPLIRKGVKRATELKEVTLIWRLKPLIAAKWASTKYTKKGQNIL